MSRKLIDFKIQVWLFSLTLGFSIQASAQITFSPFSDAIVSKVAGSGVGFDLNANPALTGQFLPGQRFQFTGHDVLDDEEVIFFDQRLSVFLLKFAVTYRISCAMQ